MALLDPAHDLRCRGSEWVLLLRETYVPVLLAQRKKQLEGENEGGQYYYKGEDLRPLQKKLSQSIKRPLMILFSQPIVFVMGAYQALIFAITYSLYTQFETIYSKQYGFTILQVGLVYLGPGLGFLVAVWFLVPRIDTVFNALTKKHNGISKPEYRLPLANIGATTTPVSLFWFAWSVQANLHWMVSISATLLYGLGQVAIFNSVQNYYIDSFEKYAASAIAAGSLFRSLIGGVVPLFTPTLLEKLGAGWGLSVFAFLSILLAPSPLLFYYFGERIRDRFKVEL